MKEHKINALTASEARANLYRLIDEPAQWPEPITIAGERNSAVLLSAEDWNAMAETLYLLAKPLAKSSGRFSGEWELVDTKQAMTDATKLAASGLKAKALELLATLAKGPFQNPPPFEKLVGDLTGAYFRRTNIQRRLVYEIFTKKK